MRVEELAHGLWRWTAPHPGRRDGLRSPGEVNCFYVEAGDATLVVDPLVPAGEEDRFWDALDRDVEERGERVAVLLTCAAHARSAGEVAGRYGAAVWGHEDARGEVEGAPFEVIAAGSELPGGAKAVAFGRHEWAETPLLLPSHDALAVGDALLSVAGELRIRWTFAGADDRREYEDVMLPSVRALLELPVDRVLVGHGELVAGGRDAIAAALDRPPYGGA